MTKKDPTHSASRVREVLRQRFPYLGGSDLDYAPGREDEFIRRLEQRTGETRASLRALLESARGAYPSQSSTEALPHEDIEQSRGSGIPENTGRSGANSM